MYVVVAKETLWKKKTKKVVVVILDKEQHLGMQKYSINKQLPQTKKFIYSTTNVYNSDVNLS